MPAVIFDVDGILVDSYRPHYQSWARLFAELDYDYTEEEFRAGFGKTSRAILAEWAQAHGRSLGESSIRACDERKELFYREVLRADFRPIVGAVELIAQLHAAGFTLGVGSSGPPENVQAVIERLPGAEHFQAIVTGADTTHGKPDPEVFLTVADRLSVSPAECAVIEDAVHGIEAANRAGMVSIALVGTATRAELSAATRIVDALTELTPAKITGLLAR